MVEALAGLDEEIMVGMLCSIDDHLRSHVRRSDVRPTDWEWVRRYPVSEEQRRQILSEIRRKTGLSPDDRSIEAAVRILEFVDRAVAHAARTRIRDKPVPRMGHKGVLLDERYRVRFSPAFEPAARISCVDRYVAGQAVRDPNRRKHFPACEIPGFPSVSLYVWPPKRLTHPDECYFMVQTRRMGAEQTVTDAWRIYFPDIFPTIRSVRTSMQLWRQFALAFGHPIRAGGKTYDFIEQEQLADPIEPLDPARYRLSGLLRPSMRGEGYQEVLLCFALDIEAYSAALRRRGVPTQLAKAS